DQLADNIVVIDHGRVIAEGTASELKGQLGGERLEISVPAGTDLSLAERTLREIAALEDGEEVQIDHEDHQLTVPFVAGGRGLRDALRRLDAAGLELVDIALRRPTLDEVFLTLTGRPVEEAGTSTENAA